MQLKEMTVAGFIEELGSNSPAPGGGSVAALNAAQAAALFGMVATLTVGNKKYEAAHEEMKGYISELEDYQKHFTDMIDKDANAFNGVFAAFQMPKDTDEAKKARSAKIQEEYKKAANVPLSVGMDAMKLLPYAEPLLARGNQSAVTDVGVGLLALRLAVIGAFYNVKINLGSIKDEAFVAEKREQMEKALEEMETSVASLLEKVEAALA